MKKKIVTILLAGVCSFLYAQNNLLPYHAVVAQDNSGNYISIQAAINATPDNQKEPWLIFVKNGSYREQIIIPKSKPFIHLIGQDKNKTIIHHNLNVGGKPEKDIDAAKILYWKHSVHNPLAEVYKLEGSVVRVNGAHFYSENISYINDWGVDNQAGPQALAVSSQADCIAFNNCIFRSFQDTWMTSKNDTHRHYAKNCWIEGAVDYFYGSGDALLEYCTFYNVRSNSVIVAPCHKNAKFGYVFRNCVVDGNEAATDGKQKLGRPWHNSPVAVYINTTMRIPIAPEGWTNMGTIPALFAEYNSRDSNGMILDLTSRKTDYEGRGKEAGKGSCRAAITKEEAENYVYENIIPGVDDWNPRLMMQKLSAPQRIIKQGLVISWNPVSDAIGYVLLNEDKVIGFTQKTISHITFQTNSVQIRAVNKYGSLGSVGRL